MGGGRWWCSGPALAPSRSAATRYTVLTPREPAAARTRAPAAVLTPPPPTHSPDLQEGLKHAGPVLPHEVHAGGRRQAHVGGDGGGGCEIIGVGALRLPRLVAGVPVPHEHGPHAVASLTTHGGRGGGGERGELCRLHSAEAVSKRARVMTMSPRWKVLQARARRRGGRCVVHIRRYTLAQQAGTTRGHCQVPAAAIIHRRPRCASSHQGWHQQIPATHLQQEQRRD